MEKSILKESSIGMALVDAIPVVLFMISSYCIASIVGSFAVSLGLLMIVVAGALKVLFKAILAIKKRSVAWMSLQFRFLMPLGTLVIMGHLLVARKNINWHHLYLRVFRFPVGALFLASFVIFFIMGFSAKRMDMTKAKSNWIEQGLNILAQLFFLFACILLLYTCDSYQLEAEYYDSLQSTETVSVEPTVSGLLFDGPGNEGALIFFAGGKVKYEAYAPLMQRLAEDGMDCFLLDIPYELAFFGLTKPQSILDEYGSQYEHWYIGGHSLGGVMAASFANKHTDVFDGLMLLASYSGADLSDSSLKVFLAYGSEDKVLNMEKFSEARVKVPEDSLICVIDGGNHGQFGNYGIQAGDGQAFISPEEQQKNTVEAFLSFVNE